MQSATGVLRSSLRSFGDAIASRLGVCALETSRMTMRAAGMLSVKRCSPTASKTPKSQQRCTRTCTRPSLQSKQSTSNTAWLLSVMRSVRTVGPLMRRQQANCTQSWHRSVMSSKKTSRTCSQPGKSQRTSCLSVTTRHWVIRRGRCSSKRRPSTSTPTATLTSSAA